MNDEKKDLLVGYAKKTETALTAKKLGMPTDPSNNLIATMEKLKPQLSRVLPKHITVDRMVRTAITCVRLNPDLVKCTPESFIGALFAASQVGLEPGGPLGLSYLIPYRRKDGKYECQYQISYKGLKELCHRSGQVDFIGAYCIRKKDTFELAYGTSGRFTFTPNLTSNVNQDDNEIVCFVSYIKYKSGAESYIHMTPDEVKRIRDKYSRGHDSSYSPWNTEFEEMALKTVIKKHLKRERLSPEQIEHLEKDEKVTNANIAPTEIIDAEDFFISKEIEENTESIPS